MSKPNRRRYKLAEVVTRVREKCDKIEIETDDGAVFEIDPPELWTDEVLDADAGSATGRALLGDRYDDFVAQGGSTALIMAVVAEEKGISAGESKASTSS